jgi:hypothetical protein
VGAQHTVFAGLCEVSSMFRPFLISASVLGLLVPSPIGGQLPAQSQPVGQTAGRQDPWIGLEYLPMSTQLALGHRDLTGNWKALTDSRLGQVVRLLVSGMQEDLLATGLAQVDTLSSGAGLDSDKLLEWLGRGATLALTGIEATGPRLLMVLASPEPEVVPNLGECFERLGFVADGAGGVFKLALPAGQQLFSARHKDKLLFATHRDELTAAIGRASGATAANVAPSLGGDPTFQRLASSSDHEGQRLFTLFVRLDTVLAAIMERARAAGRTKDVEAPLQQTSALFTALGLNRCREVSYQLSLAAHGGFRETVMVSSPKPRTGILALLDSGSETPLQPPPIGDDSVSITSIRLPFTKLLPALQSMTDAVQSSWRSELDNWLTKMSAEAGLDMRVDLLNLLGDQLHMLSRATTDGPPSVAALIPVTNPEQLTKNLRRLTASQAKVLTAEEVAGQTRFQLRLRGMPELTVLVDQGHLLICQDGNAWSIDAKLATNQTVAEHFARFTPQVVAAGVQSWSDTVSGMATLMERMSPQDGKRIRDLAVLFGTTRWSVLMDDRDLIANQAEFTPRNVQTAAGRASTVFAIELAVQDAAGKLKPGMPADVDFSE